MIRLNLLPKTLRRRVEPGWWRLVAILFALAVFGALGLLHYSAQSQLAALRLERDTLKAEVEALAPFIAEQNRLNQERKTLESLLAIRERLRKDFAPWSDYLAQFIRQIPREGGQLTIALKSVGTKLLSEEEAKRQAEAGAYDGKPVRVEFSLQGEAMSQAALIRFLQAFETSPRFGVSFQGASLDPARGVYTFSATVGLLALGGETGAR